MILLLSTESSSICLQDERDNYARSLRLTSVQTAEMKSFQEIFLPSVKLRPLYEIGTSWIVTPCFRSLAVISGSTLKLFETSSRRYFYDIKDIFSEGTTLVLSDF